MFKYSKLKNLHLEITNRCQAACPMCSRNYRGEIDNPYLKISDWTLNEFNQIVLRLRSLSISIDDLGDDATVVELTLCT